MNSLSLHWADSLQSLYNWFADLNYFFDLWRIIIAIWQIYIDHQLIFSLSQLISQQTLCHISFFLTQSKSNQIMCVVYFNQCLGLRPRLMVNNVRYAECPLPPHIVDSLILWRFWWILTRMLHAGQNTQKMWITMYVWYSFRGYSLIFTKMDKRSLYLIKSKMISKR